MEQYRIVVGGSPVRANPGLCSGVNLRIGRRDPADPGYCPEIDLGADPSLSRRHARLVYQADQWFIEDTGSKHGTLLDGQPIKGLGRVPFSPGTPVVTGQTHWTLVPASWLVLHSRPVIVAGPCVQALNDAWRHCGLGVAGPLQVWNPNPDGSAGFKLGVELEGYSERAVLEMPGLGPGARRILEEPVRLVLNGTRVRAQAAPAQAPLRFWVNGMEVPAAARPVWVLSPWDWPQEVFGWHSLAAYVCPGHPVVREVVAKAAARLGLASFQPMLDAGGPKAEERCLQALYEELAERQIHYTAPRLQRLPAGTTGYQSVRPPHEVLPRPGAGQGSCLDLSLLWAGCMEQAELKPLVIFIGPEPEAPTHCMVGCWLGASAGLEPVLRGAERLRALSSEQILAVESTGLTCTGGVGAPGQPLTFEAAVRSAHAQLTAASWACAVNVAALRPPAGAVLPMGFAFEPVVAQAYAAAEELARRTN